MTPETAVHIISQALWTTFLLCAPLLLIGFSVGIVVNIIQIATSMQDSAFSTIPRLAAFLFGFLLLMPWMLKQISSYSIDALRRLVALCTLTIIQSIPPSLLYGFLLVLARIVGMFMFLPLPGFKSGPERRENHAGYDAHVRHVFALAGSGSAAEHDADGGLDARRRRHRSCHRPGRFVPDRSGNHSPRRPSARRLDSRYASTIDPNTEADSTVLILMAQLTAGMLFFALGFDRLLLSILARSLETHPPGRFVLLPAPAPRRWSRSAPAFFPRACIWRSR